MSSTNNTKKFDQNNSIHLECQITLNVLILIETLCDEDPVAPSVDVAAVVAVPPLAGGVDEVVVTEVDIVIAPLVAVCTEQVGEEA